MTSKLIAIDPGEKHNGIAELVNSDGWVLTSLLTLDQEGVADRLEDQALTRVLVVIEEYRLYPWLLQQQGYSAVKTVEMIGVVRHICRRREWRLVEQPATIKKPAAGWMQRKGIDHQGKNQHERDAEMHAYHYLLKEDWSCQVRFRLFVEANSDPKPKAP